MGSLCVDSYEELWTQIHQGLKSNAIKCKLKKINWSVWENTSEPNYYVETQVTNGKERNFCLHFSN